MSVVTMHVDNSKVYVLTSDGIVWYRSTASHDKKWEKLPPIPFDRPKDVILTE